MDMRFVFSAFVVLEKSSWCRNIVTFSFPPNYPIRPRAGRHLRKSGQKVFLAAAVVGLALASPTARGNLHDAGASLTPYFMHVQYCTGWMAVAAGFGAVGCNRSHGNGAPGRQHVRWFGTFKAGREVNLLHAQWVSEKSLGSITPHEDEAPTQRPIMRPAG